MSLANLVREIQPAVGQKWRPKDVRIAPREVGNMMMKYRTFDDGRPAGFYWVRRPIDNVWIVAELIGNSWRYGGADWPHDECVFTEIGPRIEPPAPEHNPDRLIDPRSDPAVSIEQRTRPKAPR